MTAGTFPDNESTDFLGFRYETDLIHGWHPADFIAIPDSFVLQHCKKLCPRNTGYGFRQFMIPDHSLHMQVSCRWFGASLAGNHSFDSLPHVGDLLIAVMGTFLFSKVCAVLCLLLHRAFQISGIRYGISVTVRIECFDSDINPNRSTLIGAWFRFKSNILDGVFNGYVMDFSHFHRLTHFNISEFRKFDISSHNTNIVFLIYCSIGLKPVMFAFERWIGSSFLKEILKSLVKIPQRLLQCNGIYFFQKSKLLNWQTFSRPFRWQVPGCR